MENDTKILSNDDISFKRGRKLGSGGNGRVYAVELMNDTHYTYKEPLVVKVFFCKQREPEKIDRRYGRFSREVRIQKSLVNDGVEGIIPIFTYALPDKKGSELPRNAAWFIMPEAKLFSLKENESLLEKIETMREVALTLKDIHSRSLAHRDVKWKNLLYYKGRLCLSDFGLIWTGEDSDLTVEGETIGPHNILPKELLHIKKDVDDNYAYSDVYLFAKTFWQYLMCEEEVFDNEYERNDEKFSLDTELDEGVSLDALHEMLEKATKEEWRDRIDISKCVELIDRQIHEIKTADQSRMAITEQLERQDRGRKSSIYTITNTVKIIEYLRGIARGTQIDIFTEGQGGIRVKLDRVEVRGDEIFIYDVDKYHCIKTRVRMINRDDKRLFIECEPCTMEDDFVSVTDIDLRNYNRICNIAIDVPAQIEAEVGS